MSRNDQSSEIFGKKIEKFWFGHVIKRGHHR